MRDPSVLEDDLVERQVAQGRGRRADEAEVRAEARREAAPAALVALLIFVVLAVVSWAAGWSLLGLPWWTWLLLALPFFLLAIDLVMTYRGVGLVRSRTVALRLLALLALGNFAAVAIPPRLPLSFTPLRPRAP